MNMYEPLTAKAASSPVGRVAVSVVRPSLNVERMEGVIEVAIVDPHAFNLLGLSVVLTQATERDAQTIVKFGVLDRDVCTVAFQGDAIVAAVNCPVVEGNMRRGNGISAVRIR